MARKKSKKAKRGRPPLADGEGKNLLLTIRVSDDEMSHLKAKAEEAGLTVADWIRKRTGLVPLLRQRGT